MLKLVIAGIGLILVGKTDILSKVTALTGVSQDFTSLITNLGGIVKMAGIFLIVYAAIKYVLNPILGGKNGR